VKAPSETDLVKQVLQWFLHVKRWPAWRMNSGATKIAGRFIRFGNEGMADVLALGESGRAWWVECKSATGEQRASQAAFQQLVESHGSAYLLVRSLAEVEAAING
jgi:hypothetical protein